MAFQDICTLLSEVLECNAYIISRKGKVLGYTFGTEFECEVMEKKVIEDKNSRKTITRNFWLSMILWLTVQMKDKCVFQEIGKCEKSR